jgi:hypothetical protein
MNIYPIYLLKYMIFKNKLKHILLIDWEKTYFFFDKVVWWLEIPPQRWINRVSGDWTPTLAYIMWCPYQLSQANEDGKNIFINYFKKQNFISWLNFVYINPKQIFFNQAHTIILLSPKKISFYTTIYQQWQSTVVNAGARRPPVVTTTEFRWLAAVHGNWTAIFLWPATEFGVDHGGASVDQHWLPVITIIYYYNLINTK